MGSPPPTRFHLVGQLTSGGGGGGDDEDDDNNYECDDDDDDPGPRQNESAGLGRVVSQWGPDVPC